MAEGENAPPTRLTTRDSYLRRNDVQTYQRVKARLSRITSGINIYDQFVFESDLWIVELLTRILRHFGKRVHSFMGAMSVRLGLPLDVISFIDMGRYIYMLMLRHEISFSNVPTLDEMKSAANRFFSNEQMPSVSWVDDYKQQIGARTVAIFKASAYRLAMSDALVNIDTLVHEIYDILTTECVYNIDEYLSPDSQPNLIKKVIERFEIEASKPNSPLMDAVLGLLVTADGLSLLDVAWDMVKTYMTQHNNTRSHFGIGHFVQYATRALRSDMNTALKHDTDGVAETMRLEILFKKSQSSNGQNISNRYNAAHPTRYNIMSDTMARLGASISLGHATMHGKGSTTVISYNKIDSRSCGTCMQITGPKKRREHNRRHALGFG